ncbi:outer membrane beta-barrel family protein [Pedobacter endophyticus]|uniref:TonB-dependent receptor n=1 Tax=Pedobacter endophyticus TaxID=2789740 RepID=A0A7U3SP87_9SPHI|nr:outer membrane beta-barrel family protein [Pedobacter endophyticus]QPH37791.1 TonB-dependent receptor [Pedobacter endophyticus]
MKKLLLSVCFLILISTVVKAQSTHTIKGRTIDTASTTLLAGTSVAILNAKDSTLVKFTRTTDNGLFEINGVKPGKFILLVSYPKYADFVDQFTLDSTNSVKDFGKINLTGKAQLLADVIIKGNRAGIKIKGDTTEFDPRAYNIEPNSKVEDLIKQFPGIQVDKDGKITAQGETITKVLVDGEEFFGDDPTLVTKNLRADMVDKIQLYDKKSDQATFTGIDDGQKTKTLNVQLKEDKKNGYFGKVEGGIATDKYYSGQAMFNRFWGKKKFSAYGITGNTGQVGLGWGDADKYGGNSFQVSDDGGIYFTGGGDDDFEGWGGQYNGEGIPVARTGGLHFDNKWNKDKESLNVNYKIGSIRLTGDRDDINQQNLTTSIINTEASKTFDKSMLKNKVDLTYEIKLDTTLTLKVGVDGTIKNSTNDQTEIRNSTNGQGEKLNYLNQTLTNDVDDKVFNINALLSKRLKKKGRTLSLSLSGSNSVSKGDGYLNSTAEFYRTSETTQDSTSIVNQNKVNDITNNVFKSNLTYTEPLSKTLTLAINYGLNLISGKSDRKSFNQSASGSYDILDPIFSNNYELDQTINQGGAIFNYKKDKTIISFGSKFSGVDYKQYDVYKDEYYKRNFINYMPQASYQYNFKQRSSLRLRYNGSTNQPSIDQIQPFRNNTDQLNTVIGNPDLDPSFRNNFNASYNSYKVLSDQYFWLSSSYSFTLNPIISDVTTSKGGKSTSRFVNLDDKMTTNFSLYSNFGRKIKAIDMNVGFNANFSANSSYNYITTDMITQLNKTKNSNYGVSLEVSKYQEKKYNFNVGFGPTYNVASASVNERGNSDGWGWNGSFWSSVQLPGKLEIGTDGNYQFNGKTQVLQETFERFIWNASVTKKFFKTENLKVSISGKDLLNQNVGFSRSAYNGNINQSTYTTIKRYFMLSVSWDFTKMGGVVKK